MLKSTPEGLCQTYDNALVQSVLMRRSGECTVRYLSGEEKTFQIPSDPVYVGQFGIPLSADGRCMAVPSWETGLSVYSTLTGVRLWNVPDKRIRNVFIDQSSVVAVKYGESLLQFDLETGRKMCEIRSTSIETAYDLHDGRVFVCSVRGKYAVVRLKDLAIERQFSKSAVNPDKCLSVVITDASVSNGQILLRGFESGRNMNLADREIGHFQRMLGAVE